MKLVELEALWEKAGLGNPTSIDFFNDVPSITWRQKGGGGRSVTLHGSLIDLYAPAREMRHEVEPDIKAALRLIKKWIDGDDVAIGKSY